MARSVSDNRIKNRTNRLRLPVIDDCYYALISEILSVGYRRTTKGNGSWQVRIRREGRYKKYKIGEADDFQDPDADLVLSFNQAQEKARNLINEMHNVKRETPATVADAVHDYMAWFANNRKSVKTTQTLIDAYILPRFGEKLLTDLTAKDIRSWHERLANTPTRKRRSRAVRTVQYHDAPATDDEKRARKATANRILTVFKAILNRAFETDLVFDDKEWRKVKPFKKVDEPVIRFLTTDESVRLINACSPDFRSLVKAALFTGCRYGELCRMEAGDFNPDTSLVYIRAGKSSKPRYIPLNAEGLHFFETITIGVAKDRSAFPRADGKPWGKSHQSRPMTAASRVARITPAASFHDLRHTYASMLAQAGADLLTISKLLGHSDTRITSRHYAHLCDRQLAAAVTNLLPGFGHLITNNIVTAIRK